MSNENQVSSSTILVFPPKHEQQQQMQPMPTATESSRHQPSYPTASQYNPSTISYSDSLKNVKVATLPVTYITPPNSQVLIHNCT